MKKILLIILLISSVFKAQGVIGTIVENKSKEPIPYANIMVYKQDGKSMITGAASDLEGKFSIKLKKGNYKIKVSAVGYENSIKEIVIEGNKKIDIGEIVLKEAAVSLGEVEVKSERSYIETKPGRQILNVGKDLIAKGGNITGLLKVVPSIEVTPKGDISIRGNSNIKILINGKQPPYGIEAEKLLKQLPAFTIKQVEVITNATAKDDPEAGGGAINIITTEKLMEGFNLALNLESGFSPFRGSAGFLANYVKGNFSSNITYGYYKEKYEFSYDDKNNFTANLPATQISKGKGDYSDIGHLVLGKIGYEFAKNNELSAEFMFNKYKSKWGSNSSGNFKSKSEEIKSTNTNNNDLDVSFSDISLNYNYKNDDNTKLDFKTHFTGGSSDENRIMKDSKGGDEGFSKISEKGKFKTLESTLDYSVEVGDNSKIETGLYFDAIWFDSKQKELTDLSLLTDYKFNQNRQAFYGIFEQAFGKFSLNLGFRVERYYSKTEESRKNNLIQKYNSFFPNVKLLYDLSKNGSFQSLNLAYSRSLRRPSYEELDPNIDYSNPFNLEKGNPNLKPEYIDKIELAYSLSESFYNINTTFFGSITNDVIQRYSTIKEKGVILSSYINHSKEKSLGVETTITLKPFRWFHISPSGLYVYQKFAKPKEKDADYYKDGRNWHLSLNNKFNIDDNQTVQLQFFYYGKTQGAFYRREPYYQANLGYEVEVWGGIGTLNLSITDIFNSSGKEEYSFISKGVRAKSNWKEDRRFYKIGFNLFIK